MKFDCLLKGVRPDQVIDTLEREIKDIGSRKNFEISMKKSEVISHGPYTIKFKMASSKREALLWGLLLRPFRDVIKRAQRIGIEGTCVQEKEGTLLTLLVLPYMEVFDRKEIPLLTQGLVESDTDNELTFEFSEEIRRRIFKVFNVEGMEVPTPPIIGEKEPATKEQRKLLCKYGVELEPDATKKEAFQMLEELMKKKK